MTGATFLAFIAVSTAVIVIPGPSVMLIVATALRDGTRAGLYTVAGVSVAMAGQLAVAVAGLTSLVTQLPPLRACCAGRASPACSTSACASCGIRAS